MISSTLCSSTEAREETRRCSGVRLGLAWYQVGAEVEFQAKSEIFGVLWNNHDHWISALSRYRVWDFRYEVWSLNGLQFIIVTVSHILQCLFTIIDSDHFRFTFLEKVRLGAELEILISALVVYRWQPWTTRYYCNLGVCRFHANEPLWSCWESTNVLQHQCKTNQDHYLSYTVEPEVWRRIRSRVTLN